MDYLDIKGLKIPVSKIVLGTSWMGLENKEQGDKVIEEYIENGGNILDTGKYYNGFKTEEYLSNWIKNNPKLRKKVIFTNKCCHYEVDRENIHYPEKNRVGAKFIEEDLNYSLGNLGLDYIDLYMMHRDDESVSVEPIMDKFEEMRKLGKINAYGVSNWSLERVIEAENYCIKKSYQGLSIVSPSYSVCNVEKPRWIGTTYVGYDYVKTCNNLGIKVLSWGSQGSGFLGNYPKVAKDKVDENFLKAFNNEKNIEIRKRVINLAEEKNVSPSNIALSFIFSQGLDILGVVGPRTIDEVRDTMMGSKLLLNKKEIEYLKINNM